MNPSTISKIIEIKPAVKMNIEGIILDIQTEVLIRKY